MARGNSTRRNLAPEDISNLIRGNKDALQSQASKGGNVTPAVSPTVKDKIKEIAKDVHAASKGEKPEGHGLGEAWYLRGGRGPGSIILGHHGSQGELEIPGGLNAGEIADFIATAKRKGGGINIASLLTGGSAGAPAAPSGPSE